MGQLLASPINLDPDMRYDISAESLQPDLELEQQIKDFYREELGRVVPYTPDDYVDIAVL